MTKDEERLQQQVSDAIQKFAKGDRMKALEACRQVVAVAGIETDFYAGCARDEGMSWEQVGAALGISKQAAQQRFGR